MGYNPAMRVLGLTGGIGTGKSTVARFFRDEGIPVVDADRIAREITEPGRDAHREILLRFGREVLLPDGRIDRKRLGETVFSDPLRRAELESVTHPRIAEGIAQALAALERALARIAAQMDPEEKASASEYRIDNSGDPESTRAQVRALARKLRRER